MFVRPQLLGAGLPPSLRQLLDRRQERRTQTTADRSLARRLRDGLKTAGVTATGLAFYVHDGTVSVYGEVRDAGVREGVLSVAAAQPGVRRILDHLQIADA